MNTNCIHKKRGILFGLLAAVLFAAGALYFYLTTPVNFLAIDLNPSIEIQTNRLDKVVSLKASNADAKKLLEGYKLTDRDLDDVIEDLVDRMIYFGYLDGKNDDILITVQDNKLSAPLLKKVNQSIQGYLDHRNLQVGILNQLVKITDDDRTVAEESKISAGKLAMIRRLLDDSDDLEDIAKFADVSVSQLVAYANENKIDLGDLLIDWDDVDDLPSNHAPSDKVISLDRAKKIALEKAPSGAALVEISLDDDDDRDGRAHYEGEVRKGNTEYEFEIDAYTGKVIKWEADEKSVSSSSKDYISLDRAKKIALEKAPSGTALVEISLDNDDDDWDDRAHYEGEMRNGNIEYEFKIDAYTGEILKWETDRNDDDRYDDDRYDDDRYDDDRYDDDRYDDDRYDDDRYDDDRYDDDRYDDDDDDRYDDDDDRYDDDDDGWDD